MINCSQQDCSTHLMLVVACRAKILICQQKNVLITIIIQSNLKMSIAKKIQDKAEIFKTFYAKQCYIIQKGSTLLQTLATAV